MHVILADDSGRVDILSVRQTHACCALIMGCEGWFVPEHRLRDGLLRRLRRSSYFSDGSVDPAVPVVAADKQRLEYRRYNETEELLKASYSKEGSINETLIIKAIGFSS